MFKGIMSIWNKNYYFDPAFYYSSSDFLFFHIDNAQ